ncbi:MAG: nucleotidyltransferase domain-containing protein [Candidatus Micrarchaeota archaeon]
MIIHNSIEGVLATPSKAKVARFLLRSKKEEQTSSEIARAVSLSVPQSIKSLRALEEDGVVTYRTIGKAMVWKLNSDSFMLKKLKSVFQDPIDIIKKKLKALKKHCYKVIIFGSVARKEETKKSDLDLCLVADNQKYKKELDELRYEILKEFGIVVSVVTFKKSEFESKKSKLLDEIREGTEL